MLARPLVRKNSVISDELQAGDLLGAGESISAGAITTVGNATILAASIATGIIYRTGPTGAYTDTTDTATNILAALAGNSPAADVAPGVSFRLLFVNTVAQAMTLAAGVGVTLGTGVTTIAASLWREYLVTILNSSPAITLQANTTSASAAVTFVLPSGHNALIIGPNSNNNITPGAAVTGTGIAANTTVIGITLGQGGMTGITLSGTATATSAAGGVALTFGPAIQIDGLRSGTI